MKLLSFGEVLFDIFPDGAHLGGAPLNFAAHCALCGAQAYLISALGKDELGNRALNEIKSLGIDTKYIALSEKATGRCTVSLDKDGAPSYNLLSDVAYDYIPFPDPTEHFDVFSFGTLALRTDYNLQTVKRIIYSGAPKSIYCDVNIRAPHSSDKAILFCLENANFLKISDEELPTVTRTAFGKEMDIDGAIKSINERFKQIRLIIITLGGKGSCAFDCATGELFRADAVPTEVISTVGAGDSFGAAFVTSYLKGCSVKECLERASHLSAFVVSKNGAVPDGIKEFADKL